MDIISAVKEVLEEIPKSVRIVAASKTRTVGEIQKAIDAGIKIIGENYVSEVEKKISLKPFVKFHLIGHLQTNKVKKAVDMFDMIETVDSIKLASEINKRAKEKDKIMDILVEVNIADEKTKSGCTNEEFLPLVAHCLSLKNVRLKGIMVMPQSSDEKILRGHFKKAFELFEKIRPLQKNIDTLSMGMSDSYKLAIEEGSNMIRIGTRIFGERKNY